MSSLEQFQAACRARPVRAWCAALLLARCATPERMKDAGPIRWYRSAVIIGLAARLVGCSTSLMYDAREELRARTEGAP